MSVKEELIYDFSVSIPRVITAGNIAIIDNVIRIVAFSETQIIVHTGKKYISAEGKGLMIRELKEERMMITGELEQISFFETL